jgi:hypothetical protein
MNLNFSGLHYYAAEDRLFSVECVCGLKPGLQYDITVRTLPVDDNPADPDDTQVRKYYRPPNCDDPSKTADARCQISEEARWVPTPECFHGAQQTSSGEYDIVEVVFDVAPPSYNFDQYVLLIYEGDSVSGPPKASTFLYTVGAAISTQVLLVYESDVFQA